MSNKKVKTISTEKILNEQGKTFITGLWGCPCHPFDNWEQEKYWRTYKWQPGMFFYHPHLNKFGFVHYGTGSNYYVAKYFDKAGYLTNGEQVHAADMREIQ